MRRDYDTSARIPDGWHQAWSFIENLIAEAERITGQWQSPETEIQGEVDGTTVYDKTLLDLKIALGDYLKDVEGIRITRKTRRGPERYLAIILASKDSNSDSRVFVIDPIEADCIDLAKRVQAYILEQTHYQTTEPGQQFDFLMNLHPLVRLSASSRLKAGHGDDAVEEACKGVGARLRKITALDLDGFDLISQALSGKSPRIRLNDGATKSDVSEQEGFMHLGMALFKAARNPRAHRPANTEYDVSEVLEWLAVASAIHRALDRRLPSESST